MWDAIVAQFVPPETDLPLAVSGLRLLVAGLLAGLVGIEREIHAKPAGLRTHILVALAACLFTLVAFDAVAAAGAGNAEVIRSDPIRVIQAVTAGMAFLAAGAIIHSGGSVHGLTTGASLWMVGGIGMSSGTGRLSLAVLVTAMTLVVLLLLRMVDAWMERRRNRNRQ